MWNFWRCHEDRLKTIQGWGGSLDGRHPRRHLHSPAASLAPDLLQYNNLALVCALQLPGLREPSALRKSKYALFTIKATRAARPGKHAVLWGIEQPSSTLQQVQINTQQNRHLTNNFNRKQGLCKFTKGDHSFILKSLARM